MVVRSIDFSPDLAQLARLNPDRYPFILESAESGDASQTYDILFAFPQQRLVLETPDRLVLYTGTEASIKPQNDFLACLDEWYLRERCPRDEQMGKSGVPFTGGWFIYLGYELVAQIEPGLRGSLFYPAGGEPLAVATRIPAAVIRDRACGTCRIVAESSHASLADLIYDDLIESSRCPES